MKSVIVFKLNNLFFYFDLLMRKRLLFMIRNVKIENKKKWYNLILINKLNNLQRGLFLTMSANIQVFIK